MGLRFGSGERHCVGLKISVSWLAYLSEEIGHQWQLQMSNLYDHVCLGVLKCAMKLRQFMYFTRHRLEKKVQGTNITCLLKVRAKMSHVHLTK